MQEKLLSRLPIDMYVQLRCYCSLLLLCPDTGQHELCKNINFAMETKAKTVFRDIKD